MTVLAFYVSHAGPGLSRARRRNLEKAKEILFAHNKRELSFFRTTFGMHRCLFYFPGLLLLERPLLGKKNSLRGSLTMLARVAFRIVEKLDQKEC